MTALSRFSRVAFASTALIGCAIFGGTVVSSAYAGTNFNKERCKIINNGSTNGLGSANSCVCPPKSAYELRQRPLSGAAVTNCYKNQAPEQAPARVTSINPNPNPNPPGISPNNPQSQSQSRSQQSRRPDPISKGNNGYGNGVDGPNPGTNHGKGVAQGGPGAGQLRRLQSQNGPGVGQPQANSRTPGCGDRCGGVTAV